MICRICGGTVQYLGKDNEGNSRNQLCIDCYNIWLIGAKDVVNSVEKHTKELGEPRSEGYNWNLIETTWWWNELKKWGVK